MKQIVHSAMTLLSLLLIAAMMLTLGCAKQDTPELPEESEQPSQDADNSTPTPPTDDPQPEDPAEEPEPVPTDFRILLSSDVHCTHLLKWYSVSNEDRMQAWVDAIWTEHNEQPFDLILIVGDVSLDHWVHGGSYVNDMTSTTEIFVEDYVSQLPADVPVFILAGNHEQYSEDDWLYITDNERTGHFVLGNNLFILLDAFSTDLDPDYHHDGTYVQQDVKFIQEMMDQYPEHDVYLVSHYFDINKESKEFKNLLKNEDRIIGLYQGHTHQNTVIQLGADCGNKTIAQCGNFSYNNESDTAHNFWGFRDIVITADSSVSRYIRAQSTATINGKQTTIERDLISIVEYK